MSIWSLVFTFLFIAISSALVLIILVQRPQGGGLATAFGGAGGGNDTAFGGRTGDALTVATVAAFFLYLLVAIGLNMSNTWVSTPKEPAKVVTPADAQPEGTPEATTPPTTPAAATPAVPETTPATTPVAAPATTPVAVPPPSDPTKPG